MTWHLATLMRDSERAVANIERIWQTLDEIRETAESPDGNVAVTVDARGRLCGLDLDPRIYRGDSTTLASDITTAVAAATRTARRRAVDGIRPLLPTDTDAQDPDAAFDTLLTPGR